MISDNALLIIDMQQGLFRGPVSPFSADVVLANIRLLIAHARHARVPVFFARHVTRRLALFSAGAVDAADTRAGREGAGCCFHQAPSQLFSGYRIAA